MKFFESKIYQKSVKVSISAIIALAVFVSVMPTGSVKAQTIFSPIIDMFTSKDAEFPVSSGRQAIKTITVVSTAYNSLEGQTDSTPCITANGHDLCKQYEEQGYGNTVAANFLRMGTQVRFPELYGDKIFIVRDRMNKRYGNGRIDIWLPEYSEAKKFGVKRLKMEIF
jgi:3D (Asp-Asp-Asp) domain-containing protein